MLGTVLDWETQRRMRRSLLTAREGRQMYHEEEVRHAQLYGSMEGITPEQSHQEMGGRSHEDYNDTIKLL